MAAEVPLFVSWLLTPELGLTMHAYSACAIANMCAAARVQPAGIEGGERAGAQPGGSQAPWPVGGGLPRGGARDSSGSARRLCQHQP